MRTELEIAGARMASVVGDRGDDRACVRDACENHPASTGLRFTHDTAQFLSNNFSILAPKNAKCCSPAGALPLGWIKKGSQPSKYWKNYWGLTGSLSIGEIYGIYDNYYRSLDAVRTLSSVSGQM